MRKYPWGTCEALSSEHSDFAALKKLLLETSFEELKEATERRYYRFREEELLNLTDPDTGCGSLELACSHGPVFEQGNPFAILSSVVLANCFCCCTLRDTRKFWWRHDLTRFRAQRARCIFGRDQHWLWAWSFLCVLVGKST